jgi:hypothetical protein
MINTKRTKKRSSQIIHNTTPLRPQVKIDNMDIAYQSEPNLLSIHSLQKQYNGMECTGLRSLLAKYIQR